jgi:hypothetical protein
VNIPRKAMLAALVGIFAAVSLTFALTASGKSQDDNGNTLVRSTLAPSVPTDPAFHGVQAGGVPWVLRDSQVELKANGRLDLRVSGLVIPTTGTTGPVQTVSASLLCGPDSQAGAVVTTPQVPLSAGGNARIHAGLTLPTTCLAPIVVLNPNGNPAAYIAISGWKR